MINIRFKTNEVGDTIKEAHINYCKKLVKSKIDKTKEDRSVQSIQNLFIDGYGKEHKEEILKDFSSKKLDYLEIYKASVEELSKFIRDNLEECVLGDKEKLILVNVKLKELISGSLTWDISLKVYQHFMNNIISEIICYSHFQGDGLLITFNSESKDKKIRWNRNTLLNKLDLRVCPYCNRQYITSYIDTDNNDKQLDKSTADADHYYPQSKYPLLALSLYNIIPSCQICNRTFKGNGVDEDNTLYPYSNDSIEDKLRFKLGLYKDVDDKITCDVFYNSEHTNLDVLICHNGDESAKKSIEIFKLDKVYKAHNVEIYELIQKMKMYNNIRQEELFSISQGQLNSFAILNYLYDFDANNLGEKPLSKLKSDIYNFLS